MFSQRTLWFFQKRSRTKAKKILRQKIRLFLGKFHTTVVCMYTNTILGLTPPSMHPSAPGRSTSAGATGSPAPGQTDPKDSPALRTETEPPPPEGGEGGDGQKRAGNLNQNLIYFFKKNSLGNNSLLSTHFGQCTGASQLPSAKQVKVPEV